MDLLMTPGSATGRLAGLVQSLDLPETARAQRLLHVREHLFSRSQDIRQPDFHRIHTRDLALLFEAYDREFFDGQCRETLNGSRLDFYLSRRMSRAAGNTRRTRHRTGETVYEIGIATTMLFKGFGPNDRRIAACGIECATRLDAVQRILEHELVHLVEMLCWETSSCSAMRFQQIAGRLFGHRSHTHNLITRRERAAEKGIRIGAPVAFQFEGRRLAGRVHRITKRATVLVEHPQGEPYSDGLRYLRYYVPIASLELQS